jgi:preprotein translocase subunit SecF
MLQIFKNPNYRIIQRRRYFMAASALMILISITSLIVKGGPEFGIDFEGGYRFVVQFSGPVELGRVREVVGNLGFSTRQIQDFGRSDEVLIVLPIEEAAVVGSDAGGDAVQMKLAEGLRGAFSVVEISKEKVGPKIGSELRRQGLWAILYSLLGLLVYITWRFEFKASVGAIVALAHDVIITLGFFSLLNKEIDLTVLGALLTLVGYSINDTIVVFDRIRENMRSRRRDQAYADVVNASINQTLSRTILTSGLTLIVVASLFFFGGAVIHDFAFALLVGIIVGTYSSDFIASPILVEWEATSQRRRARRLAAA